MMRILFWTAYFGLVLFFAYDVYRNLEENTPMSEKMLQYLFSVLWPVSFLAGVVLFFLDFMKNRN